MRWSKYWFVVAASLVFCAGVGLRTYHLGDRSLWYDEAVTANISRGTITQMVEGTRSASAPILHPLILYVAERFSTTSVAVRAPSAAASILAVLVLLAMVYAGLSREAALLSGAILALSASQVRYAQEVREYSLSVLVAACLVFLLLRWEVAGSRSRQPVLLYGVLFIAPFVQYGLVLLGFAAASTILLRSWLEPRGNFRLVHALVGAGFLGLGGITSLALTLRYQVGHHALGAQWYLAANYFDSAGTSLFHFLAANSRNLISFVFPGHLLAWSFGICAILFCGIQCVHRQYDTIAILAVTSVTITILGSIAGVYPYGGLRQCLFLAPVLSVFAGFVFADLSRGLGSFAGRTVSACIFLILFSGYRGLLDQRPYGEYEDTVSILKELAKTSAHDERVWVNHDAVDAFSFYIKNGDPRFIYGRYHDSPQAYIPELRASLGDYHGRLWLVFSHLEQPSDRLEEQFILNSLRSSWDVNPVIEPKNTALYVAQWRVSRAAPQ